MQRTVTHPASGAVMMSDADGTNRDYPKNFKLMRNAAAQSKMRTVVQFCFDFTY
jgi:hypothetical protein